MQNSPEPRYQSSYNPCSHPYTKIQNHPGNFDNYSIKNNTNDQLVVISKKKLLSKPEDEYDEYLIIK